MTYDVVIVGGGPAGLTAGLYSARRSLKTLIVSKDIGGQAATTSVIENYPGVGAIDGLALMQRFKEQAEQFGAEFVLGEVTGVRPLPVPASGTGAQIGFKVQYNTVSVETRSVILAFGLTPRSLGIPGEQEFTGRGVNYSTADLSMLRDKIVLVVGGGNSAVESVNMLAGVAKRVYVVHRRDRFRAEDVLMRKMQSYTNVELMLNAELTRVIGKEKVTGAVVRSHQSGAEQQLEVDEIFVHVGFVSQTSFVKDLIELTTKNEIIVQPDGSTALPGVFAAGDSTTAAAKQVVVSAGEGCKAALAAFAYVMKQQGRVVAVDQDWEVRTGDHFIRT